MAASLLVADASRPVRFYRSSAVFLPRETGSDLEAAEQASNTLPPDTPVDPQGRERTYPRPKPPEGRRVAPGACRVR